MTPSTITELPESEMSDYFDQDIHRNTNLSCGEGEKSNEDVTLRQNFALEVCKGHNTLLV